MKNTMNPTKTTALKNHQKSPLRRPGAALAPMPRKAVPASLQRSACPFLPSGGIGPAGNPDREAKAGQTEKNPPGPDPESAATAPRPAAEVPDVAKVAYWTIQHAPISDEAREQYQLGPKQIENPHGRLCDFRFSTVRKLMAPLRTLGKSAISLKNPGNRLALVHLTTNGYSVSLVPSYAAAVQLDRTRKLYAEMSAIGIAIGAMSPDEARAKLAMLAEEAFEEVPDLKRCPFCRKSDLLEIIGWTHERPDWTECHGDAVMCNRCDAIAPLAAWQGATAPPAGGSEVKP